MKSRKHITTVSEVIGAEIKKATVEVLDALDGKKRLRMFLYFPDGSRVFVESEGIKYDDEDYCTADEVFQKFIQSSV
jgi:hypothetical protein